jgi:hypothetical protein
MHSFLTILQLFRGAATMRNLSRYGLFSERAAARWYRREVDFLGFNAGLLAALPSSSTWIAAFDATFLRKSGRSTYGLASFFDGASGAPQRGLELSLLAVVDVEYNTAYPLLGTQTPAALPTGQTRRDFYLQAFRAGRAGLPTDVRYLAVDGYYPCQKFVAGVRAEGLHLIGNLRRDADLRHYYTGPQKARGRRRLYAEKVDWRDLSRFQSVDIGLPHIAAYTAVVHSKNLKCAIRVLYLVKTDADKTGTALLFSTDTELDPALIRRYYKARFQIEFVFRDAKQHTGLADAQVRGQKPLHFHLNAALTALNLIKIQDRLENKSGKRQPISIARHKIGNYNQMLARRIFQASEIDPTLLKSAPNLPLIALFGLSQPKTLLKTG